MKNLMIYRSKEILFVFLIIGIIVSYFTFNSLNVDSTWILYVASQITEGKTLYTDVSEVNPPLIFIYSTSAIYLSKIFDFTYSQSYIILVSILIGISSYLSFLILESTKKSKKHITYYLYVIIFILTIVIIKDYGQREHLLVIFIFPYILFSIFKDKIQFSNILILIIIIFASFGFNLKPHFFLVFFAIEIVYAIHYKKISYLFRWDSFIIFFTGVLYLILILLKFPEYINFALPLALETYSGLFNKSFLILLKNNEVFIFFITLFIYLFFAKRDFTIDSKVLLITILSLFIIYLLQQKGWFYHRLPFFVFTIFFLFYITINYVQNNKQIYILSAIPLIMISILLNIQKNPNFTELKDIVNNLEKKSKVHILSVDIARGQTLLIKKEQIWSSRFGALGILPSVLKNNNPKIKKYLFDSIYEDLLIYQPDTIIFADKYSNLNYYEYFYKEDKRIKNIYNTYYTKSTINGYTILKKTRK